VMIKREKRMAKVCTGVRRAKRNLTGKCLLPNQVDYGDYSRRPMRWRGDVDVAAEHACSGAGR
jgi:hypothetical protein